MHILLTDQLVCPRCGPGHGLILRADRLEDRRVLDGALGCANCRESYPVREGLADLRFPAGLPLRASASQPMDPDEAVRLAALLGVVEGGGMYLVVGPAARLAGRVASLVPHVEVIGVGAGVAGLTEQPGVSRVLGGAMLPFTNGSIRGVALTGDGHLDEALRVLAPAGRLVVEAAPAGLPARLRERGLRVLLDEGGVVVASTAPVA